MTTNAATTITLAADDKTAAALVATIRSAVNGAGKYAAYVAEHDVTRENVKFHAAALAALAYPKDEPVQKKDGKRTRYGNAVQAAGNGLRSALPKGDLTPAETDYLAAVLKSVKAAREHGIDADKVLAAVADTLGSE